MSTNPIPRVISTLAALAVALVGLLPVAHFHADDDHRVVHRHSVRGELPHHDSGSSTGHANVDHADHSEAQALNVSYEAARQLVRVAFPTAAPCFLADTGTSRVSLAHGRTLLPTHDPPLRFVSSPAPPAAL